MEIRILLNSINMKELQNNPGRFRLNYKRKTSLLREFVCFDGYIKANSTLVRKDRLIENELYYEIISRKSRKCLKIVVLTNAIDGKHCPHLVNSQTKCLILYR